MGKSSYNLYPGARIHNWVLLQRVRDNPNSSHIMRNRWRLECQCPARTRVTKPEFYLTRKNPLKDCGCSRKSLRTIQKREYGIWQMMRRRCTNPTHISYKHYGGRGIKVCEEWSDNKTGFETFFAHIGPAPSRNHTIDRYPDNDGNYEPGNVRWATPKEQRANQRPKNG